VSAIVADLTRAAECSYTPQAALSRQLRLQELISTATRELRTPLTSLHATLELLKEEALGGAAAPEQTAVHVERALRQTRRLIQLAADLLDVSRLDGDAPLATQPVELAKLGQSIRRGFAARLQADGRRLRVQGEPAVALADPAAVARILRILVNTAAACGAGTVTVAMSTDGEQVLVAVTDEGPGIAPEEREHIFGSFVRRTAAAGAVAGAELVLSIARWVARAMGWELNAARAPRARAWS
jgi:signal transduction histidine kinase